MFSYCEDKFKEIERSLEDLEGWKKQHIEEEYLTGEDILIRRNESEIAELKEENEAHRIDANAYKAALGKVRVLVECGKYETVYDKVKDIMADRDQFKKDVKWWMNENETNLNSAIERSKEILELKAENERITQGMQHAEREHRKEVKALESDRDELKGLLESIFHQIENNVPSCESKEF